MRLRRVALRGVGYHREQAHFADFLKGLETHED